MPDNVAAGVVGGGTMPRRIFRPKLVQPGFYFVRVGQGNVASLAAPAVRQGVAGKFEELSGVRVDDGGTFHSSAAADTAYD